MSDPDCCPVCGMFWISHDDPSCIRGVADDNERLREENTRLLNKRDERNKKDPIARIHNLVDSLQRCDRCEAETTDDHSPVVLCGACYDKLTAALAERGEGGQG